MIARTSAASVALRTKLSAMKSTPRRSAQRRSSVSFSDSAGTETATPGRLIPLLLETLPGTTTSVTTSVSSTDDHLEADLAVVDQQRVARLHVAGQALVRRPALVDVADHVAGGDREGGALLELHRPVAEGLQPDLRALQVGEDADRVAGVVGGLTHQAVDRLVVGVRAVAHVEAGDVHARLDEGSDPLRGVHRGAEGADDLGSTHVPQPSGSWIVPSKAAPIGWTPCDAGLRLYPAVMNLVQH